MSRQAFDQAPGATYPPCHVAAGYPPAELTRATVEVTALLTQRVTERAVGLRVAFHALDVPFGAPLWRATGVVMARRSVRTLCPGETQAICGAIHGARATAGPVLV